VCGAAGGGSSVATTIEAARDRASEGKPSAKLEHAGAAGTGDSAERGVVDAQLGIVVVRPVWRVDHVGTDLQPSPRRNRKVLGQRHVKSHGGGTPRHVQHVRARTK